MTRPSPDRSRAKGPPLARAPDALYRFVRLLVHGVNRAYWRVTVEGAGQIPADGPVILAPVHRSLLDFLIVSEVTPRKVFYMAKDDLWRSPRLGVLVEALGGFPVNRQGADRLALDRAQEVLERGDVLILFPEGTRRAGRVVQDLHEGAAFLAGRTGAAIVPIGIGGSERAMPKGSKVIRPVKVRMVVGRPLWPPARPEGGRLPRREVHRLTEELTAELQRVLDLAMEAVAPSAADVRRRRATPRGRVP